MVAVVPWGHATTPGLPVADYDLLTIICSGYSLGCPGIKRGGRILSDNEIIMGLLLLLSWHHGEN